MELHCLQYKRLCNLKFRPLVREYQGSDRPIVNWIAIERRSGKYQNKVQWAEKGGSNF
jgi:hypothetical protein